MVRSVYGVVSDSCCLITRLCRCEEAHNESMLSLRFCSIRCCARKTVMTSILSSDPNILVMSSVKISSIPIYFCPIRDRFFNFVSRFLFTNNLKAKHIHRLRSNLPHLTNLHLSRRVSPAIWISNVNRLQRETRIRNTASRLD